MKRDRERSERKRRRLHGTCSDNDNVNSNDNDDDAANSSLRSLVLPWVLVAGVAVVAAVYMQYTVDDNDSLEPLSSLLNRSVRALKSWTDTDQQQQQKYARQQQQHAHHEILSEDHDPLFPLTRNDFVGFSLAVLGLMVAAGGGIGGGGILVPIYILVMGFGPKHAIPLSNVTVFGGAVANTILNTRKRHPFADRPLVDWDLILVMEPLTIAGALIGAVLNKILPETLLVVLLVLLLSFTAHKSLKKAFKMYHKETAAMLAAGKRRQDGTLESELTRMAHQESTENKLQAADTLLDHMEEGDDDNDDDSEEDSDLKEVRLLQKTQAARQKTELEEILQEERVTPMLNIAIIVTMFIVVLAINVLKGGGAFPSPVGIECGSTSFWMANVFMIGWILLISLFVRAYLVRRYEIKKECSYPYVEGDIEWDARATLVYPVICMLAGFFAGMFGVGGGIVKGPLLLAMNVHPTVSSATSACMILFTSFTATTSFIVFGLLLPDYAVICLIVGFVATIAGQLGLSYLMRKAQRNSYIAFSIGGVVLLSAFLMTIQSLLSMASGEEHHAGGICGKGD